MASSRVSLKGRKPPSNSPEPVFGIFDLLVGGLVYFATEGVVDDVLAEGDELALEVEVMENAAVFAGVDDGRRRGGEIGEICRAANVDQAFVLLE